MMSRAKPKSEILQMSLSSNRMFRAARSRCSSWHKLCNKMQLAHLHSYLYFMHWHGQLWGTCPPPPLKLVHVHSYGAHAPPPPLKLVHVHIDTSHTDTLHIAGSSMTSLWRREATSKKTVRHITRISCFVATMKLPHALQIYATVFVKCMRLQFSR